ncbi:MAG: protease SohB [Pseudomonadales bacterium]|nr:protease SohB [Pseudomonadales bacterium]
MELLTEYGLFLAKTITIVVAILVILGGIASASNARTRKEPHQGEVKVAHLNERYEDMEATLKEVIFTKEQLKEEEKAEKKKEKEDKKEKKKGSKDDDEQRKKRIYVIDFDGDVEASEVEPLGQTISAVLTLAEKQDEIVLRLESPGGQVHAYGLASSQLSRIREHEIPLTICVDKVAASGGYMMACNGDKILAAPFAILGSIGVVAELPNFNRVLRKYDVDYDIYTAGDYKRTVTMLGENTEEGKRKFNEEIEETHVLFKNHVSQHRPQLDLEKIATGEHWYGSQALDLGLIDEVKTSDEYIFSQRKDAEIFEVTFEFKRSMAEKLGLNLETLLERTLLKVWNKIGQRQNTLS